MLCYFVNCLVLQAQQSKSTVQVLSKQKVLLDSFSIRSNQPITQLHSQVYVDYEKGNPKTFWKNLAFFTGSMALGSQLGQQLTLPQATENFSNSVQKSLLFPSISLAFIPNIWHNRPRGVPDVNLRITHLNQQGTVLNTWERALTQEAKKGPTLLDIKLDTILTSGKIEVSLENSSKRKVAYWASEVTPTRLDSIKPTTPTTYEPFVISRVSVRRDKLAVLPEQEVVSKINTSFYNNLLVDLPKASGITSREKSSITGSMLKKLAPPSTPLTPQAYGTPTECSNRGGVYDYRTSQCTCPDGGFDRISGQCIKIVVCGDNATEDPFTHACVCDYGYAPKRYGDGCEKVDDEYYCKFVENGVWDAWSHYCITGAEAICVYNEGDNLGEWNYFWNDCDQGNPNYCRSEGGTWNEIDRECVYSPPTCPEGYEQDANGNCVEVSCPDGYEKDGNGNCVEVPCPEGYQRNVYGECVPKIPVVEPPLPPVTWGSRTYNDPETQKNYYSEEKRCEGIQDMWNNAVTKEKEVFAFLLEDGTLVTIPFQGNTMKNADVPRESYIEPNAGFYLNGEGSGSYEKIVATIHTHNECVNDGTNGVSGNSPDDIKVYNAFSQFSPAITHYVVGCGVMGETDANGNINNKQWGPLYQTCWNIK